MSNKIKLVFMALLAAVAVLAIAAGSATAAEPEFKSVGTNTFPQSFTGQGGLAELNTAATSVHCPEVHVSGKILAQPSSTSSMLGDALFHFLGCTLKDPLTGKADPCTTSGGSSGLILTPLYLWHLGLLKLAGNVNDLVIIILVTTTKFSCATSIGAANVSVVGTLVGGIGAAGKNTKFTASFKQLSMQPGKQEVTEAEVFLPKETKTGLKLEATIEDSLGTTKEEASEVAMGPIEGNETELVA